MEVSRRTFLRLAAGTAAIAGAGAGAGYGIVSATSPGSSAAPALRKGRTSYPYRSRPDLRPPQLSVEVAAKDTARGWIFLNASSANGHQPGPLVAGDRGETVWFSPLADPATTTSSNLQVQTYRGEPVLTWWEGKLSTAGYGQGEYVLMDATYREIARIRAGNGLTGDLHEFVLTPAGTALLTAYQPRPFDLSPVHRPSSGILLDSYLQEVDVASGKVLFQWRASDHVPLTDSYAAPPAAAGDPYDFFHINSVDLDDDGDLIVSSRHTWAIFKLDRSSGTVVWRIGGKRSDFAMGPGTAFSWQHHARHHPGGVMTLFDDGAGIYPVEKQSRGLKLSVDTTTRRVELVEQYLPHPSVLSSSQGSAHLQTNGNVLVGWGAEPYVSEYGSGGDLRFVAKLPGVTSYRAFRFPWHGRPAEAPAVHAERAGDAQVTMYASWNGATGVHRWDVLAAKPAGALERIESFTHEGFETAMTVASSEGRFAVAAFDKNGRELSRSSILDV